MRDQRGHLMPALRLSFGEVSDVILDAAQDREVVFVDVKDLHLDSVRLVQDTTIGVERLLRGARPGEAASLGQSLAAHLLTERGIAQH